AANPLPPACAELLHSSSAASYNARGSRRTPRQIRPAYSGTMENTEERKEIMPYILAWLLGVPAFVLLLIWLFVH
ncbi:hypothetical protein, partial [Cupriavidus basilensis]|uniref:hypothetical protein n=1 Tax=Cupriavidus basilensis TaxID=68895 RepID=UPI0023E8F883